MDANIKEGSFFIFIDKTLTMDILNKDSNYKWINQSHKAV